MNMFVDLFFLVSIVCLVFYPDLVRCQKFILQAQTQSLAYKLKFKAEISSLAYVSS